MTDHLHSKHAKRYLSAMREKHGSVTICSICNHIWGAYDLYSPEEECLCGDLRACKDCRLPPARDGDRCFCGETRYCSDCERGACVCGDTSVEDCCRAEIATCWCERSAYCPQCTPIECWCGAVNLAPCCLANKTCTGMTHGPNAPAPKKTDSAPSSRRYVRPPRKPQPLKV